MLLQHYKCSVMIEGFFVAKKIYGGGRRLSGGFMEILRRCGVVVLGIGEMIIRHAWWEVLGVVEEGKRYTREEDAKSRVRA